MFFSQLFFQGKAIEEEEAFVLFVRKNALQILIPKYGLEGTVFMNKQDVSGFTYNEQVFFSQTFFQYIVILFHINFTIHSQLRFGKEEVHE